MDPVTEHSQSPDSSFDGGDLDCGNGLLLLIREHLDKLHPGQLLEIKSIEVSVDSDLPAWCRLTKNDLVSWTRKGKQRSFLICKGRFGVESESDPLQTAPNTPESAPDSRAEVMRPQVMQGSQASAPHAINIEPLAVMGIGSWPRQKWMLNALHEYLEGKLPESEFQETANDAVRIAVDRQVRAGVDVVTDGEQRRDNYASFVGKRLTNCRLVPLVDLIAMVDDPEELQEQIASLDVPATEVRHPVVTGRLERSQPLALHELRYVKGLTDKPIKVALPGPYLLTRTMWLHCITDKVYATREELADDIVRVLREEVAELLAEDAAIVQLDEPVLTEVVFGGEARSRTFMCGALSERLDSAEELQLATTLINRVVDGFPIDRLAMHICRGNWTPDESVALKGGYEALMPVLKSVNVGTLFLEFCTPRAGELKILSDIPKERRIGLGVTNPKDAAIETRELLHKRLSDAASLIGWERLFVNPDCGFATFADNPVTSADASEAKLRVMSEVAHQLRKQHLP